MKFTVPITKNHEFKRVYNKGASASGQNLVVYCRRWRDRDKNRLGLTVSTKVGKAVQRNKIRRRLKEIYRLNEEKLSTGWDIILVARVRSRNAGYSELERDFFSLCARLKLMAEEKDEKDTNMDSKIL